MSRDTFDMFAPSDRGRFGDNEQAPQSSERGRATGASELVDVNVRHFLDLDRPKAIFVSKDGDRVKGVWLPRSQIKILELGPPERKLHRIIVQDVKVTLPMWLAKDKRLI